MFIFFKGISIQVDEEVCFVLSEVILKNTA